MRRFNAIHGLVAATVLLTAMVVSAWWVAVFHAAPSGVGRCWLGAVIWHTLGDLLRLLVAVVVLCVPLAFFLPVYQCDTNRFKVVELWVAASGYRAEIADRAQARQSLSGVGDGLAVKAEGRVKGGTISGEGVITLYSDDPKSLLVLRPRLEDGTLQWKCAGFPLEWMPIACRHLP